jgi:hypothetical protein
MRLLLRKANVEVQEQVALYLATSIRVLLPQQLLIKIQDM